MTRSNVILQTAGGTVTVGNIPRVVGTLSSLDFRGDIPSDIVEVRLDRTGRPSDWLERCKAIEAGGKPVLLTPRLKAEGGSWEADDLPRLEIYKEALRELAAVGCGTWQRDLPCGCGGGGAVGKGLHCLVSRF